VAATAGTLTVTGLSEEHDAVSQPVTVAQDEAAVVRLTLPRQFARLHVESDPGGQQPRVDGVPAADCPATPCDTRVTAGVHQVTEAALAPAPGVRDAGAFTAGVRAYLSAQGGGSYGVYLEELGSGSAMGVGDTTLLEAASVIKVPEALYLLHQADAGKLSLDD